jgi:glycosyltransferase involved in cell wall biosynthesis
VALARGLAARGHTCFVAAPPGSPTFDEVATANELSAIPFNLGPKLGQRSALDLALHWHGHSRRLRSFLDDMTSAYDIDIVHAQFKKEQLLATPAAIDIGLPVIWTEHSQLPRLFSLAPPLLERYRRVAGQVSRILCVSTHVRVNLTAHGVTGRHIEICYPGLAIPPLTGQLERRRARGKLGLEPHHFVVGCTARLVRSKGQRTLLEAAARARPRIPGLRVVLVGDGPERAALELLTHQLDLAGHTQFLGKQSDADAILPAFDVFVAPSLSDGLPLAVLEAMAAERPVIGTHVGAIPEVLADGAAGMLIEAGRSGPLAAALERLFEAPKLRSDLGTVARRRVIERYSLRHMLDATEAAMLGNSGRVVPDQPTTLGAAVS